MNETYIGDGVYVSFDGFYIQLRTPREHGDEFIYLDSQTYGALVEFVDAIKSGKDVA